VGWGGGWGGRWGGGKACGLVRHAPHPLQQGDARLQTKNDDNHPLQALNHAVPLHGQAVPGLGAAGVVGAGAKASRRGGTRGTATRHPPPPPDTTPCPHTYTLGPPPQDARAIRPGHCGQAHSLDQSRHKRQLCLQLLVPICKLVLVVQHLVSARAFKTVQAAHGSAHTAPG
jgi:hypothetical protein